MKVAFIAKMSDKLLEHMIEPIQHIGEVEEIGIFRTAPISGNKIKWMVIPALFRKVFFLAQLYRVFQVLLHAREYDVLIGCFQIPHGMMAWLAGKLYGIPVIQTVISEIDKKSVTRFLAMEVVMKSEACTVMGPICKDKLIKRGYANPIEVIQLSNHFSGLSSRELPKKYDLVAVGNFVNEKDYPWMVEVLVEVKKAVPDFKIAIRAGGDTRRKFPEMIRSNGLSENIELLGYLTEEELLEVYMSSKVYFLTSWTEGLTTALVEAMFCGLPAIVTEVGNLPWLVRDGLEGRVVPHGNTQKMADAVIETLSDDKAQAKYKENTALRMLEVKDEFKTECIAKSWERLFKQISKKRN